MKKHTIEMTGAGFDDFALFGETQADGARLLREREGREQAARDLAARQIRLSIEDDYPAGPLGRSLGQDASP